MTRAIIGYTGFIGSNLVKQMVFDDFYDSKNIENIRGKSYDLVISMANSAFRWKVNQNPMEDFDNIKRFIEDIKTINANCFVLISTIDVYKNPNNVDEDSETGADDCNPYGKNRLYLENFIKNKFESHLIIRLPIVYGSNFKKNIIYDALNNHEVEKIDPTAKLQFYNVANLAFDIERALKSDIKLLNLATAPILVKDLMRKALGIESNNPPGNGLIYNMKTKYASCFGKSGGYLYSYTEIINDIRNFKKKYKHES